MNLASPYRGRLAPSPTGYLHLGHARTFWRAHERARARGGTLILRNEDLDAVRFKLEFVGAMLEDLHWFGFAWSEGPDVGGKYGPYNQSERMGVYRAALEKLRAGNFVYPCTCSRKDIQTAVTAPHAADDEVIYPGTCRPKCDPWPVASDQNPGPLDTSLPPNPNRRVIMEIADPPPEPPPWRRLSSLRVHGTRRPTFGSQSRVSQPHQNPVHGPNVHPILEVGTPHEHPSGAPSWPSRGNPVSLSPGERAGVRAGSLDPNFPLGTREGAMVSVSGHHPGAEVAAVPEAKQGILRGNSAPCPSRYAWRFRVPDGEAISFTDGHFGRQSFVAGKDFGDFVVWRGDDVPAYQLACVVDDAAMRITEVVRGADLLVSTARQLLLYRALELAAPDFCHCELLRDAAGQRLAKRHDALSLRQLRAQGAAPEELRAGWAYRTGRCP